MIPEDFDPNTVRDTFGNPAKVIIIDDMRHDPRVTLELLAMMGASEHIALERVLGEPPPRLPTRAELDELAPAKSCADEPYTSPPPRSPWDRGTKGERVKESLTEMMERLARETKQRWTTPTITEDGA